MSDEPIAYQIALAVIMGVGFYAVSSLDLPRWFGSLVVGVIAVTAIALLKWIRRRPECE